MRLHFAKPIPEPHEVSKDEIVLLKIAQKIKKESPWSPRTAHLKYSPYPTQQNPLITYTETTPSFSYADPEDPQAIYNQPDYEYPSPKYLHPITWYQDIYQAAKDMYGKLYLHPQAINYRNCNVLLEDVCQMAVRAALKQHDLEYERKWYKLHYETLLIGAQTIFDMYLQFTEWNRQKEKRFYLPRRSKLRPVVEAMQELADMKINILGISLPPGVGKSTLALFYLTWMAGRYPDKPILTGSHSNAWVRGAYDECLRMMDPKGDYQWRKVFPLVSVTNTNAKDCRIDLNKRKRFETLEFTSVGSGNAGLYRAATLLYCDDLIPGMEVALSKERLDKLWELYTTDLRQRKIGDKVRELHIATRWSVHDVIGRLEREYEDNTKIKSKFIRIPALNEKDESNFDYAFGVGFTTDFYKDQRNVMDDISWRALYMNEPIEREGVLYHEDELRRYFELPDLTTNPPDAILAVCDTKDRGADFCVMPIAYQYGNDFYIEDFICDNSNPDIVDERLIEKLLYHHVNMARFESNSAGGRVAKTVQDGLKAKGSTTKITTQFTTANKQTKIITRADYVKEHFLFKDKSAYVNTDKEYRTAMNFLTSYTVAGKNKHDDVPDAIAQLVDFIESLSVTKIAFIQRPF